MKLLDFTSLNAIVPSTIGYKNQVVVRIVGNGAKGPNYKVRATFLSGSQYDGHYITGISESVLVTEDATLPLAAVTILGEPANFTKSGPVFLQSIEIVNANDEPVIYSQVHTCTVDGTTLNYDSETGKWKSLDKLAFLNPSDIFITIV